MGCGVCSVGAPNKARTPLSIVVEPDTTLTATRAAFDWELAGGLHTPLAGEGAGKDGKGEVKEEAVGVSTACSPLDALQKVGGKGGVLPLRGVPIKQLVPKPTLRKDKLYLPDPLPLELG